jgi:hypothetical protein
VEKSYVLMLSILEKIMGLYLSSFWESTSDWNNHLIYPGFTSFVKLSFYTSSDDGNRESGIHVPNFNQELTACVIGQQRMLTLPWHLPTFTFVGGPYCPKLYFVYVRFLFLVVFYLGGGEGCCWQSLIVNFASNFIDTKVLIKPYDLSDL